MDSTAIKLEPGTSSEESVAVTCTEIDIDYPLYMEECSKLICENISGVISTTELSHLEGVNIKEEETSCTEIDIELPDIKNECMERSDSALQTTASKIKWNVYHILEFLNIYQHYPVLWNTKDIDYCNMKLKIEIFQHLYNELNEKQLIMGMDMKQLKARIKSIKDVYRQELNKIEKSKKNGTEKVYAPKLAWFTEAFFLAEVLATRSSKSNLDPSQNSEESVPDENSEKESVEYGNDNCPEETTKKLPAKMRPPATPTERSKKRAPEKFSPDIPEAINQLDKEEKPYDQFGRFVASELRKLPQRQAILLQQDIQNCIIRSKLASLRDADGCDALSLSSNRSSNNDDNVVQYE